MFQPTYKQHMSTAALCKGKQSRSVFRVCSGHPSGVWASLIILSCPIIVVYAVQGHRAICSDYIDAEIRGVEGHISGGQSGDTSFE